MTTTKPQSTTEPNDESCPWCKQPPEVHAKNNLGIRYLGCPTPGCTGREIHFIIDHRWNTRTPASAAPVVDETVYADGFCVRCSELAYPLTRALEKTGVPTGADNWQQTYGPNKVRALADLETCLRRLLFALEEGKPENIKERITRANHYIEFHAAIRRRLTVTAQEQDSAAAATAAPVEQSDDTPSDVDHLLYRLAARDCERLAAGMNDCTEELPYADWCVVCQSRGLIQKYRNEGAR